MLGAGLLVLEPGVLSDVEDLAVPVPHHPGPGLSSHYAGQLRLEAPPGLQDVLLQRQDGGGEENLQQVILTSLKLTSYYLHPPIILDPNQSKLQL